MIINGILEDKKLITQDVKKPFTVIKLKGIEHSFTCFSTSMFETIGNGTLVEFEYTTKTVGDKTYRNIKKLIKPIRPLEDLPGDKDENIPEVELPLRGICPMPGYTKGDEIRFQGLLKPATELVIAKLGSGIKEWTNDELSKEIMWQAVSLETIGFKYKRWVLDR